MSGHTPGPWNYCGADREGCKCMTVMCADHPVAKITSGLWGDEFPSIRLVGNTSMDRKAEAYIERFSYGEIDEAVAKANARLIAAAPELLDSVDPDTLEAIANEIDCFEHSARAAGLRSLAKRQRAAIAKAEGRS